MLRRGGNASCFFCLSAVGTAAIDPRSFRCPHCGCWNRFDASGEILSDEPAMHHENLNARSFAKRASPSKDRLPSTYGKGPFCHTCQTNQMLLVNLLSNYLPHPQHPNYAMRLENLPAYRESLHVRYPPVCPSCLPAVRDEIEQKNQMARIKALGGWLKESKGKERHRLASTSANDLGCQLAIWRLKGVLWWSSLLCVLVTYIAVIRGYDFPHSLARAAPALPAFSLFSFSYTTWDPTYYRFKKAKVQGRDLRIKGKTTYIILQMLSWLSRLTSSVLLYLPFQSSSWDFLHIATYPSSYRLVAYCSMSLIIELLVLSTSFTILHLQRPPTIRLLETSSNSSVRDTPELSARSARVSPMPSLNNEPDLLASLTLSSNPLISSTSPVFGHPSLVSPPPSQPSPIKVDEDIDEDAMDWTPTNPSPLKVRLAPEEDALLRPQRFFPPERPTGLESLFASTKLDDGDRLPAKQIAPAWNSRWGVKGIGWSVVAMTVLFIPLGSVVYHSWKKGWIQ